MTKFRSHWLFWVGIPFSVYFLLSITQWHRLPIEDEIHFNRVAEIWAQHGSAAGAHIEGLWHTPYYLECLKLWQKIWGTGIASLRSFGTVISMLTAAIFLVGLTVVSAGRVAAPKMAFMVALLLFHPYFFQSSLLLDIDNTLLIPALLFWIVLVEAWDGQARGSWKLTLAAALILGISLMIKELTPLMAIPLWVFYACLRPFRIPRSGFSKPHFIQSIVGAVCGFVFFLILLRLWTWSRGFDFLAPLELTFAKIRSGSGGKPWVLWGWARWGFLSYLPILWLGIPALYCYFTVKLKAILQAPLALWFAAGIVLAYTWIVQVSYYFPKYSAPALPMLLLAVVPAVSLPVWKSGKTANLKWALPLILLLAIFGLVPALDSLMIIEQRTSLQMRTDVLLHGLSLLLPLVALVALNKIDKRWLFAGLLVYQAASLAGQLTRDRNATYLYGEAGTQQAIAAVARLQGPNRLVVTPNVDLRWNLRPNSWLMEPGFDLQKSTHSGSAILFARTYGIYSIDYHPEWRVQVSQLYRHHQVVDAPGKRFEWWWN